MISDFPQSVYARVIRRYSAAPEELFAAWLDPEIISTWMFWTAVRDEEVVRIWVEARPGGSFSFAVRRQGEELDHFGEYLELDPPRRLVFTWGVRQASPTLSRVSVDIVPLEAGSSLILTHELHPDWADFAGFTKLAWAKMLAALARTLNEANSAIAMGS